jgi:hypothetical protein
MFADRAVRCRKERVIAEVRTLVEAGYREVVISGINLGRWGRDCELVRVSRQSFANNPSLSVSVIPSAGKPERANRATND